MNPLTIEWVEKADADNRQGFLRDISVANWLYHSPLFKIVGTTPIQATLQPYSSPSKN